MVQFIRERVLSGELLFGVGCILGSSLTVEMAGKAGFDWLWLDLEHGSGDYESLVGQIQAAAATGAAPIVRIRWNDPPLFKRVLDLGAAGIVVPWVNSAEEARRAVRSMRYPPEGIRGVARLNRATGFGTEFEPYFSQANEGLLTVTQIETGDALEQVQEIAAVEGVDVLFIGPLDLSVSLGVARQWDHPRFLDALRQVAEASRREGKIAGILIPNESMLPGLVEMGYSFFVVASDGGLVASGLERIRKSTRALAERRPG